jgi:hypothetical protein
MTWPTVGPWPTRNVGGKGSVAGSEPWPFGLFQGFDGSYTPGRFYRWDSTDGVPSTPTAGGYVDGVSGRTTWPTQADSYQGHPAVPGLAIKLELGGSVSQGDQLATDGSGRAIQAGAGDIIVARALEGGSSGATVWVAIETQREL